MKNGMRITDEPEEEIGKSKAGSICVCTPDQYCRAGISGTGRIFETDDSVCMPSDV